jgi:branched-subunit amino acid transport protein
MPAVVKRALRFVPVSIFTAVMAPQVLATTGTIDVSFGNTRLWAALVALVVAWRTRNVLATVVVGMAALLVLQNLS